MAAPKEKTSRPPKEPKEAKDAKEAPKAADAAAEPATPAEGGAPKARVVRLPKPDRSTVDAQVAQLDKTIKTANARVIEISELVSGRNNAKSKVHSVVDEARKVLNEVKAEFRARLAEKKALKDELHASDAARDALRAEAAGLKTKLSVFKVEEIDEEVRKLEGRLAHSSVPLAEEKKIVSAIAQLKASRAYVADYSIRLGRLTEDEAARKVMVERIREKDALLTAIKAREDIAKAACDEARARVDAAVGDVPALLAEKAEAKEIINAAYAARRELQQGLRAQEDAYYAREREWRESRREESEKRRVEGDADRARRAAERKARDAEFAPEPYADQINAAELLIGYVSRLVPAPAPADAAAAAAAAAAASAAALAAAAAARPNDFKGMTVRSKKADDEQLSGWFSGLGKPKKGSAASRPGSAPPAPAAAKVRKDPREAKLLEKLSHPLDCHASFAKLGLLAPMTGGDCEASVVELKAKLAHFTQLRAEKAARAARGEPDEEEEKTKTEAAPASPAAAPPAGEEELEEGEIRDPSPSPAGPSGKSAPAAASPAAAKDKAVAAEPVPSLVSLTLKVGKKGGVSVALVALAAH